MIQTESKYSVQQEELEYIANRFPLLGELDSKSVLVTGATGLLGTQLVKTLLCYNRVKKAHIHVIACVRSAKKLEHVYGTAEKLYGLETAIVDVCQPIIYDGQVDYIIHCASVTSSQSFVKYPVDTIKTALNGTMNVLEYAKGKQVSCVLYISSLEVYGNPPFMNVSEEDYGFIDFLNVRSSYSEGKRMAECLCRSYLSQYGVPVKIARLTQTVGSGIEYSDNRVFAQFAKCVIEKQDIVLNTAGKTVRSYCDICDAVRALITILLKGKVGEAYNVANPQTALSIAEMAQMLCDEYPETGIRVVLNTPKDLEKLGYNPDIKINLNTDKLEALGWHAEVGISQMYRKLINGLREKREET